MEVGQPNYRRRLLSLDRSNGSLKPTDFPVELKTKIANERTLALSNEFIRELFVTLFDSIVQVYLQLMKF